MQLARRFVKIVQTQPLQVRIADDHRLCCDQLADKIHQLVELGLINADTALLCFGQRIGRLGRARSRNRRLRGRGCRLRRGCGRRGLRLRLVVQHRIIFNVYGAFNDLENFGHWNKRLKDHLEAVFDNLSTAGGVVFRIGRDGCQIGAQILKLGNQHECADVFHLAVIVKKDPDAADFTGLLSGGRLGRRRCFGGCGCSRDARSGRSGRFPLHNRRHFFQLGDDGAGVLIGFMSILNAFDLVL